MIGEWLLCDFHIHIDMSYGELPIRKIIDLFGQKKFDVIAITDHILDSVSSKIMIKSGEPINYISPEKFQAYLETLWNERKRAWEKYNMLLIPGVEITNNHNKYHILGIDIKTYIDPTESVEVIIDNIHHQGGVAIACHPHHKT